MIKTKALRRLSSDLMLIYFEKLQIGDSFIRINSDNTENSLSLTKFNATKAADDKGKFQEIPNREIVHKLSKKKDSTEGKWYVQAEKPQWTKI